MNISLQKSNHLKSIAILMMLFLHLFNRDWQGLFQPVLFIGKQLLSYYISLFCDACVPIFAFVSGYGLYFKYLQNAKGYRKANLFRLKKLYVNYWIIVILFAVLLGWLTGTPGYPGSGWKLLENMSGLNGSYNGAWWFFTTYVFFVLTSSFWFKMMDKTNPYLFVILLLIGYIIAFYFRMYRTHIFDHPVLQYLHVQSALYFCTLLQFMLGAYALKFKRNAVTTQLFSSFKYPTMVAIIGIVFLIVFHGTVPNFIVAPFTGLGFIFLFLQIRTGLTVDRVLDFFTPHATNLWLVHMFFYMVFFKDFIYSFNYVPAIFAVLLVVSILSSYVINYILNITEANKNPISAK